MREGAGSPLPASIRRAHSRIVNLDRLAQRLGTPRRPPSPPGEGDRLAAVALLLRRAAAGSEVLLMRRSEREGDRWSGQIALPGGHSDPADADLVGTARRETLEEVGVDLDLGARLLGELEPVQAKARGALLPMWITPFVFLSASELAPRPGPEAVEVFWFPLERARDGQLASTYRYQRGEEERVLPAWNFEGRVVWGLTYEILTRFLRVAG